MIMIFGSLFYSAFSVTRSGIIKLSSPSTTVVLHFTIEHKHRMSTRTSTFYKYVKEHYPTSEKHHGVHEHQVENQ
jgi:hypothetical protein